MTWPAKLNIGGFFSTSSALRNCSSVFVCVVMWDLNDVFVSKGDGRALICLNDVQLTSGFANSTDPGCLWFRKFLSVSTEPCSSEDVPQPGPPTMAGPLQGVRVAAVTQVRPGVPRWGAWCWLAGRCLLSNSVNPRSVGQAGGPGAHRAGGSAPRTAALALWGWRRYSTTPLEPVTMILPKPPQVKLRRQRRSCLVLQRLRQVTDFFF